MRMLLGFLLAVVVVPLFPVTSEAQVSNCQQFHWTPSGFCRSCREIGQPPYTTERVTPEICRSCDNPCPMEVLGSNDGSADEAGSGCEAGKAPSQPIGIRMDRDIIAAIAEVTPVIGASLALNAFREGDADTLTSTGAMSASFSAMPSPETALLTIDGADPASISRSMLTTGTGSPTYVLVSSAPEIGNEDVIRLSMTATLMDSQFEVIDEIESLVVDLVAVGEDIRVPMGRVGFKAPIYALALP